MKFKIEIFGPPGSGKSHLASHLSEVLRKDHGLCTHWSQNYHRAGLDGSSRKIFFSRCHSFKAHSKAILWVLDNIGYFAGAYFGNSRLKRKYTVSIFWQTVRSLLPAFDKISDATRKALVMEPGFCMAFMNGYLYAKTPPRPHVLNMFLKKNVTSGFLIGLRVEPTKATERLKSRPRGAPERMRQLSEGEWFSVVAAGNHCSTEMLNQAEALGLPCLLIDTTLDMPPSAMGHVANVVAVEFHQFNANRGSIS